MADIMNCGHNANWMIRVLDRGIRFKLCFACMNLNAGIKADAYGTKLPLPVAIKKPDYLGTDGVVERTDKKETKKVKPNVSVVSEEVDTQTE